MSTSPHEGRLLGAYPIEGQDGDTSTALGASLARDYLLNNLCHYADEYAQVRVAWTSTASAYSGGQGYLAPGTTNATFVKLYESHAWPIAMRADGSSYRLRIRTAFARSAGAGTITLRVVLGAAVTGGDGSDLRRTDDGVYTATVASSSAAWVAGTTGATAYTTFLYLTPAVLARYVPIVPTSTLDDLGGAPASVNQPLVRLRIYAKTSDVASQPRLHGLYAAEWIGE